MKIALLVAMVVGAATSAETSDLAQKGAHVVSWKTLTFQAKKLVFTATAEVRLEALKDSPELQHLPGNVVEAQRLEIRSGFLNRRSSSRLLLDSQTGATFERRQLYLGRRNRLKTYTYEPGGVRSTRTAPANEDEARKGPSDWTERSEWSYEYPRDLADKVDLDRVIEPGALLYLVSSFEPEHFEDGLTLPTFSSSALQLVEIRYLGTEAVRTRVEFIGESQTPEPRTVQAHSYAVRPLPIDGQDSEDFQLLGLEGAITLLVEAEHLIPLEVRGKLPPVGEVVVKLISVELASAH